MRNRKNGYVHSDEKQIIYIWFAFLRLPTLFVGLCCLTRFTTTPEYCRLPVRSDALTCFFGLLLTDLYTTEHTYHQRIGSHRLLTSCRILR